MWTACFTTYFMLHFLSNAHAYCTCFCVCFIDVNQALLYPWKFWTKENFTPRNYGKFCYTPWKCYIFFIIPGYSIFTYYFCYFLLLISQIFHTSFSVFLLLILSRLWRAMVWREVQCFLCWQPCASTLFGKNQNGLFRLWFITTLVHHHL